MLTESISQAEIVGNFYDRHSEAFLSTFGEILQAFRAKNVHEFLDYEAQSMEINDGMKLLDAGCGVCGPAIHFAKRYMVAIDAITASAEQARIAKERVQLAGLAERITVTRGDFHQPEQFYQPGSYQIIYFLESFGHSNDKELLISSAWNMLVPGGRLYIKDLFIREPVLASHTEQINQNTEKINEAYCYSVNDLYQVLYFLRKQGFIISFLKTFDIPFEAFENLAVVNNFQQLTGINQIDDLMTYIFPIDFFELLCIKPGYPLQSEKRDYFLQNLYNFQIHGLELQNQ